MEDYCVYSRDNNEFGDDDQPLAEDPWDTWDSYPDKLDHDVKVNAEKVCASIRQITVGAGGLIASGALAMAGNSGSAPERKLEGILVGDSPGGSGMISAAARTAKPRIIVPAMPTPREIKVIVADSPSYLLAFPISPTEVQEWLP